MVLTTTDYSAPSTHTFTARAVAALRLHPNVAATATQITLTMDAHAEETFKVT